MWVYESHMNLFLRLANRPEGAKAILDSMLFDQLLDCQFLRERPVQRLNQPENFGVERFSRLFKPVLSLCSAILMTLGRDHPIASRKVVDLLKKLSGVIIQMLRDSTMDGSTVTLGLLEEQKELVCLLSLLAPHRTLLEASVRLILHPLYSCIRRQCRFTRTCSNSSTSWPCRIAGCHACAPSLRKKWCWLDSLYSAVCFNCRNLINV
jgi:hypothetical protein